MSNTNNTSQSQNSQKAHNSQESHSDDKRSKAEESRPAPIEVLRQARAQLAELTGLVPESVTSFEQTEDGWVLEVEVLELARVPDTMSLMASYQIDLDQEARLTGYRRVHRYERGRSDARRPGGR
ncbi:gas vesicle protein GvpO [Streptomyces barringtoniae]|uniref:gas vesicle protein GvpO n=1 Tax=Streptomyces barringtoniae TaxID=2892029 RepID=UPI001E5EE0D8|nr:gas vesicle protein [Streptomyces barringtoniae]MCC5476307.1 gas vesicle protein [Streptomyces barringtoniae]